MIYISCLDAFAYTLRHLPTANVVSIRDSYPSQTNTLLYAKIDQMNIKNLYILQMDDIVYQTNDVLAYFPKTIIPNKEKIQNVLNWSKSLIDQNSKDFIVHCTAGVSRSSAVAILIQCLIDDSKIFEIINPKLHYPNSKILNIGEQLLNKPNLCTNVMTYINREFEKTFPIAANTGDSNVG